MKVVRRVAVLVGLLLVLSGCGVGSVGSAGGEGSVASDGSIRLEHVMDGYQSVYMGYERSVEVGPAWRQYIDRIMSSKAASGSAGEVDAMRAVLADGVITADEMNDLESRALGCFAKYGYKPGVNLYLSEDGGGLAMNDEGHSNEETFAISNECIYDNGYGELKRLYHEMWWNPDNVDLGPYRFRCYQEHGFLLEDYSYEEYERLRSSQRVLKEIPRSGSQSELMDACTIDPLHNISDSPLKGR